MILLPANYRKERKRVGRGWGSGHGKTSCRGQKGQKSRTGRKPRLGFEGGQMPLTRRVPKRGFTNIFKTEYQEVNISQIVKKFKKDDVVSPETLYEAGVVKKKNQPVKLLSNGDIDFPLMIKVHAASKKAIEKVEKAGGKVEVIS